MTRILGLLSILILLAACGVAGAAGNVTPIPPGGEFDLSCATGFVSVVSNPTEIAGSCATLTPTSTSTATPTTTATATPTLTATRSSTPSPTPTATNTPPPTPILLSVAPGGSFIAQCTTLFALTDNQTNQISGACAVLAATATPTVTLTPPVASSATPSATPTASPTATVTPTALRAYVIANAVPVPNTIQEQFRSSSFSTTITTTIPPRATQVVVMREVTQVPMGFLGRVDLSSSEPFSAYPVTPNGTP